MREEETCSSPKWQSVAGCVWGWDKRLRLETAFWTKPIRSYLSSSFHNSPTVTPAMWKKPRAAAEAVNQIWPVTPLHCQQLAKRRTMQTRPFHSIIPAGSTWRGLVAAVKHRTVTHENRDKCTGNFECWGEDWVTTGETGFSPCHLHTSSEEGWPPVLKALGAINLQWSKAWWRKPSTSTLQTLHYQLTSEHSQPLSCFLAKAH